MQKNKKFEVIFGHRVSSRPARKRGGGTKEEECREEEGEKGRADLWGCRQYVDVGRGI